MGVVNIDSQTYNFQHKGSFPPVLAVGGRVDFTGEFVVRHTPGGPPHNHLGSIGGDDVAVSLTQVEVQGRVIHMVEVTAAIRDNGWKPIQQSGWINHVIQLVMASGHVEDLGQFSRPPFFCSKDWNGFAMEKRPLRGIAEVVGKPVAALRWTVNGADFVGCR